MSPSFAKITDIETLRQVADLQEREIVRLVERVRALTLDLARLRGRDTSKVQAEIEFLLEQISAQRQAKISGHVSERRPGAGPETSGSPAAQPVGHGPRPQPELAIETRTYSFRDKCDHACPACGKTMAPMKEQYEESDEITIVERHPIVLHHRRQKYRCACNESILTAPAPPKLQSGGRYSIDFAVEVAVGKYLDHLPLERQSRIFAREGLRVDSQTLWDQLQALARHAAPTWEALWRRALSSPVLHADETPWRMLTKASQRWCVWTATSAEAACYRILDSRSKAAAAQVLDGFQGILVVDGYAGYDAIAPPGSGIRLAHCWAHVRRKFVEIESSYPQECGEILRLIGELYGVESGVRRTSAPGVAESAEALALRAELRRTQSRAIVTRIRDWAYAQHALPGSAFGQAIQYLLNQWYGLVLFLEDARVPLDNNAAERALRGVVVGRKNHYGSKSKRGTEVAAILYTLLETAKLRGVDPKSYLRRVVLAAIEQPGTATLPDHLLTTHSN